jgi:dGTPase
MSSSSTSKILEKLSLQAPDFKKLKKKSSKSDARDSYQVDLGRIIHSAGFRRLQAKTQVMGTGEGDFHRTRLTHSLEVGQIARGIVWRLKADQGSDENINIWLPSSELIEAISYAHDIGHPPFGHSGEKALQEKMEKCGGFEGNAQNIRLLTRLEKSYWNEKKTCSEGIKPSRRLILGILKYPISYENCINSKSKMKFFYNEDLPLIEDAIKIFTENDRRNFISKNGNNLHKTFDCSILELADDIAYGVHDLEDGIGRGLLRREHLEKRILSKFKELSIESIRGDKPKKVVDYLFSKNSHERKRAISKFVSFFINNTIIEKNDNFESPFFHLQAKLKSTDSFLLKFLKEITYEEIISRREIKVLEQKWKKIIQDLFETLFSNPYNLIGKKSLYDLGVNQQTSDEQSLQRAVCDFIAGMTNPYAEKFHRRLFEPGYGSSTDEL